MESLAINVENQTLHVSIRYNITVHKLRGDQSWSRNLDEGHTVEGPYTSLVSHLLQSIVTQ